MQTRVCTHIHTQLKYGNYTVFVNIRYVSTQLLKAMSIFPFSLAHPDMYYVSAVTISTSYLRLCGPFLAMQPFCLSESQEIFTALVVSAYTPKLNLIVSK